MGLVCCHISPLPSKMSTEDMSNFESGYAGGYREAIARGLDPDPAQAHAWATGVLKHWGFTEPQRPDIVSGYRSPQRQRELRDRWERGDRAGLYARPALRSWHTVRRAWDVETEVDGFDWYRWLLETYWRGIRWGGRFSRPDDVHFDWPTANRPPSIYEL